MQHNYNSVIKIYNITNMNRGDFVDFIESFRVELIKSWCLCKYFSLYDKNCKEFYKWKKRFVEIAGKIKVCELNGCCDKVKVIEETYIGDFNEHFISMVEKVIISAFKENSINEGGNVKSITEAFVVEAKELVRFLGDDNYYMTDYINNSFLI